MAYAVGSISLVSQSPTVNNLVCTAATGGTGPYTYQWYKSTSSGFTPGAGNIITGATGLSLADSAIIPNLTYYYKLISTDTGHSNDLLTATQLAVTSLGIAQDQNLFLQASVVGMIDLKVGPTNVLAMQVDATQATAMYPGQAVTIVDSYDGIPKVIAAAANNSLVHGHIVYDRKSKSFVAGDKMEVAAFGACVYMYATGAIARGAQVTLNVAAPAGVQSKNAGDTIIGWAYDKAAGYGSLIRVMVEAPRYVLAV